MNIQNVTEKTGLTKRMIRHYEELGLIKPSRGENNYRDYSDNDINRLQCVKALRSIGFSLESVGLILKEENAEQILRAHLQDLLFKQQETFLHQKTNVETIKRLLNSRENTIHGLLDKIANVHSPTQSEEDTLDDFLARNRVIHGRIKDLELLANIACFGSDRDFRIAETTFMKFGSVFVENIYERASICSCAEVFTHFTLMTSGGEKFDEDFHRLVWAQFGKQWMQVAPVLGITFEAITKNMTMLQGLFSSFDIAVVLRMENAVGEHFQIVLPVQPLIVYLKSKAGGCEYEPLG